MLQVGLKLGKFLEWRDVTRQESVHILTVKGTREDDSAVLCCATVSSVKRETSIFEIIKTDAVSAMRARALSRELVKHRLRSIIVPIFSVLQILYILIFLTNNDKFY